MCLCKLAWKLFISLRFWLSLLFSSFEQHHSMPYVCPREFWHFATVIQVGSSGHNCFSLLLWHARCQQARYCQLIHHRHITWRYSVLQFGKMVVGRLEEGPNIVAYRFSQSNPYTWTSCQRSNRNGYLLQLSLWPSWLWLLLMTYALDALEPAYQLYSKFQCTATTMALQPDSWLILSTTCRIREWIHSTLALPILKAKLCEASTNTVAFRRSHLRRPLTQITKSKTWLSLSLHWTLIEKLSLHFSIAWVNQPDPHL